MLIYGEEVIFVAESERFGRLVRDIVGKVGLRQSERLTGVSAAYIGFMKKDKVPSEEIIAQFAAGFRLSPERTRELFGAAREGKSSLDLERGIQALCEAAGMTTEARLRVLDAFRAGVESAGSAQERAA